MRVDAKRCTKCGEYKPLTEFHKQRDGRDGLRSQCKGCASRARAEWSSRNPDADRLNNARKLARVREWLWAEKSKPCERCGNTYHPVAMQFDHLPGAKRLFDVSVGRARNLEAMKAERAKCQLLCANCHHIVTWERKTGETVELDSE